MKVHVWIKKEDVTKGKWHIDTEYALTRPYHDRNDDWVEISISVDEFRQLEDNKWLNRKSIDNQVSIDFDKK